MPNQNSQIITFLLMASFRRGFANRGLTTYHYSSMALFRSVERRTPPLSAPWWLSNFNTFKLPSLVWTLYSTHENGVTNKRHLSPVTKPYTFFSFVHDPDQRNIMQLLPRLITVRSSQCYLRKKKLCMYHCTLA